jgi:hypothetical protein
MVLTGMKTVTSEQARNMSYWVYGLLIHQAIFQLKFMNWYWITYCMNLYFAFSALSLAKKKKVLPDPKK